MSPTSILESTRARPFEPFRIFLSDGKTYDIRHPEMCMVGYDSVLVGVPKTDDPIFDRMIKVSLMHIVRLEPLPTPARPVPADTAA
jgi:hypothetical protein